MSDVNPLISLAAGGISGAVSKTITAPLEKVKLAIQNQDSDPRVISGEMKRYAGMGDAFRRHITELGPQSLWRGNFANCVRYVPTAACNLAFKDNIKKLFPKYNKNTEFGKFAMAQIASGAAAGGVTNTLVYPLIYVRTVLGADLGKEQKYNGMADCIKKTIKSNGFMSLYNGIGPSTLGIVVYRGAQFGLQDILKAFNPYQKDFTTVGLVSKFAVAQVAVSASGIAAYPLDTMQRRLQIESSKPKADQMYNGMGDCFTKILKNEGPGGFFKGALANVLRGTGAALVLVIYDEIMNAVSA
ncbi:putative carrier protein [Fragilariopsis cylindrus CCMP1102]|jgi:solute carrier family 25 (adenine nucleotide translocator) protein 4/5/6/31|uniref:ADP/ATP translocase n=1 Tax=Fragilariopsis cylindrus CCMP1102 TaxID=635003 RepID=A0A1E7FSK2_9STRA|nr:putative carrier protein [Fragilariopsis cylindrus CCMP1102]|eukprot:OEU21065.1 putative carrier protein [Fragilariopsis cylindrus CCMP1102]